MIPYSRINNLSGWLVFGISAAVYLYTMEPTVSLWDCGEFIAASGKLEVGHPPGAPFYLMLARIFSMFAPDPGSVALYINALSAVASAFTVLFLFWTITRLIKKIVKPASEGYSANQVRMIMLSAAAGALTFAFTDSFWFSATEAEVYALSSMFTAIVFWCILKWEAETNLLSSRWIVLIAYLMGISIGVHLLNLLALPAIAMVYYIRNHSGGWKKLAIALFVSFLLLLFVLYGIIPGMIQIASVAEMMIVNSFGWPVNTGLALFTILTVAGLIFVSWHFHRKGRKLLNTAFLCLAVILIGYSSYAMIVIRASANTPLNTGDPSNAFSLLSYLNRDQYGDRPLIYGQYYNAPVIRLKEKPRLYRDEDGIYREAPVRLKAVYDERFMTIFPRMYSTNENHIEVYKNWGTITGIPVEVVHPDSSVSMVMKPGFLDNLEFFVKYQVGYMYFRYFLWNFAGKQNDMQGNGGILKGNWISGFDFIDKWFIGSQNSLPAYLKANKGKNRYFFIPLIIGIAGFCFHFFRDKRYASVVTLLFLLTGIGIVVYTNQTPLQPRERDYVYVGSFYAFSIWIGFGIFRIVSLFGKYFPRMHPLWALPLTIAVPALLFFQNFDDHNRHGRTIVRDIAANYLNTCEQNAILFTVGDNDTYPLWCLQEVEGIRTDVRVVNLMLLNAPWYISQMRQQKYQSDPLPVSLTPEQYGPGNRNSVTTGKSDTAILIRDAVKTIADEDKRFVGSRHVLIPADTTNVRFKLPRGYLSKNEMIVLDILAHFDWERPVYFNSPAQKGIIGLGNQLQLQGFSYKLVPERTEVEKYFGRIDTEQLYDMLMNRVNWSNSEKDYYPDDHIRNMLAIMKVRQNYARLSLALSEEGKSEKAEEVLDRVMKVMPHEQFPYDHYCVIIAEGYYRCGAIAKADKIVEAYGTQLMQELEFFGQLPAWMRSWVNREKSEALFYLQELKKLLKEFKREDRIGSF